MRSVVFFSHMEKRSANRFTSLIVLLAIFAGIIIFARGFIFSPTGEIQLPGAGGRINTGDGALPSRLIIPALEIDAYVQHVGVGKSGNMAVPSKYADVAWYKFGTRPGDRGSAVIAGHVDNGFGLPGVFEHLHELESGDEVFVETGKGERFRYKVLTSETYPYDEAPLAGIFNQSGGSFLNLITCRGEWLASQEMYEERLVIYAQLD